MNLPVLKQIGGAIKSTVQTVARLNPITQIGNQFERFKLMADGKWKEAGKSFGKDLSDVAQVAAMVGTGGAAGGAMVMAKSVGMGLAKDIGQNSIKRMVMDVVKSPNLNKADGHQSNAETAVQNMGSTQIPLNNPGFKPVAPESNFQLNFPEYSGPQNMGIPSVKPYINPPPSMRAENPPVMPSYQQMSNGGNLQYPMPPPPFRPSIQTQGWVQPAFAASIKESGNAQVMPSYPETYPPVMPSSQQRSMQPYRESGNAQGFRPVNRLFPNRKR